MENLTSSEKIIPLKPKNIQCNNQTIFNNNNNNNNNNNINNNNNNENDDDDFIIINYPSESSEPKKKKPTPSEIELLSAKKEKEKLFENQKKELETFLKKINMESYTENFFNEGFDDINLIITQMKKNPESINENNLIELGIKKSGDRAKILIRFEELIGNFNNIIFPFDDVYYVNKREFKLIHYDFHLVALKIWLKEIQLEKYLEKFFNNGYQSKELIFIQMFSKNKINYKILDEIGIDKNDRKILMDKIKFDSNEYYLKLINEKKKKFKSENNYNNNDAINNIKNIGNNIKNKIEDEIDKIKKENCIFF